MTFVPTPEQQRAIEHHTGPMLVVAGAGSGKTSVLVQRIAWLIREKCVKPDEILALTYTINAAARMSRGVQQALGREFNASALRAQTFHGYCAELLKKHSKFFEPLEENDLKVYLNMHVADLPLKVFSKAASPGDFIGDLLTFNDRCQDDLVNAVDYRSYVERLAADESLSLPRVESSKKKLSRDEVLARCREIADVYSHVTGLLKRKGWGTFGNMVIEAVELLTDPRILAEERARTRFILIDEFQDSNFGQIELAQKLGGSEANIFAVGDPDQAIYRFRGATSAAFDEFKKRFPQTKTTTLSTNYRSTRSILKTAYAVISENRMEERIPLVSGRAEQAEKQGTKRPEFPLEVVTTPDQVTEAKTVVDQIEAMHAKEGCKWSDFAVLYRQHDHRAEVMAELSRRGIPYEARNTDLLCAPEVRDAIALLRAVLRTDDAVSYFRVAALARFKVDADELKAALANAKRDAAMELTLREVKNGRKVLEAIAAARKKIDGLKPDAAGAVNLLVKEFGIARSAELKVFQEFVSKWQKKPTTEGTRPQDFCEYLDCFIAIGAKLNANADGDEKAEIPDAVQLMTAHAAKGLEFKYVYVVRVNSASFPSYAREPLFEFPWELSKSQLSIEDIPDAKQLHYEEERRLFYVACTRAEDRLSIYGKFGGKYSRPSGYVKDLLENKELKAVISPRRIDDSRVDLNARAETLTPVAEWITAQPEQMSLEQLKLSASSIECYDSCGMKYWLRYVWKLAEEPAATLQYGSVIHTVLKGYFDSVKAGVRPSVDVVLSSFRDLMENAHFEDKHQFKLYSDQGTRHLTAFVQSRVNQPLPKVLETEKSFKFEMGDVLLQGRMDRIDELPNGNVAIEDYKTGKAKNEKFAEKSLQLTIYALASKREGKRAERVSIYNLENDSVITVGRDDKQLADGENRIREAAEGIRAGRFEANPGFQCRWCAYTSICPAKEERVLAVTQTAAAVQ